MDDAHTHTFKALRPPMARLNDFAQLKHVAELRSELNQTERQLWDICNATDTRVGAHHAQLLDLVETVKRNEGSTVLREERLVDRVWCLEHPFRALFRRTLARLLRQPIPTVSTWKIGEYDGGFHA